MEKNKTVAKPREKDFRLGQFHGRFSPKNKKSEAQIRNVVFLSQRLKIWKSKNNHPTLRVFGYEVPLEQGVNRGKCVDIMAYDKEHNLYLIELKKGNSKERISKINDQLDCYEKKVIEIKRYYEKEFENVFFLKIEFNKIHKVILAPRKFYTETQKQDLTENSIDYAYYSDNLDSVPLNPKKIINIHLVKKMR